MPTTSLHSSKHRLLRHYKRMFPPAQGLYLNRETERRMRHDEAKDRARALMAAVDNLGVNCDADELAETVNDVAPGRDWMVEPRERFDELRDHYKTLFELVEHLKELLKKRDANDSGLTVDAFHDALHHMDDVSDPVDFA